MNKIARLTKDGFRNQNTIDKPRKSKRNNPDYILMAMIILTTLFGVLMVYSASRYYCANKGWAPTKFAFKQLSLAAVGFIAMYFIIFKFDYHSFFKFKWKGIDGIWLIYWVCIILAASVKFIGIEANGAKRWLQVGPVQIQPSEFLKIAVALAITHFIVDHKESFDRSLVTKGMAWVVIGIPAGVVTVLGSNLSSGIVILGIGALIIMAASKNIKTYLVLVVAGVAAIFWVRHLAVITPQGQDPNVPVVNKILVGYRLDRVRAWIDPFTDPKNKGYQPIQSLYSVSGGGLFGKGIFNGVQKLGFLPEPYNDIIFAVICEELGLVGAIALMVVYMAMVIRGLMIAIKAKDYEGAYVAIGISGMIGLQAVINAAVNTNTIPTTGMQLPLVSYGGTALVVLLATLGILLNISTKANIEKFE